MRISSGGTLTINDNKYTLQLGQVDEGFANADNYGTLNISNGSLTVNGKVKHFSAGKFNMTGGNLTIDANKGTREMSVANGNAHFEAVAGMSSFNFSGGTLRIINPPFGSASQTIKSAYDFGTNSTLIMGSGTSNVAGNNPDGFGGLSFPNKIGKLIIDAGTKTGNRQFVNKKLLEIKGSIQVKSGSVIIMEAPVKVSP